MDSDAKEWFEHGVEQGWLQFYTICSTHGGGRDPECTRCNVGSWGLTIFEGEGHFRQLNPEELKLSVKPHPEKYVP